MPEPFYPKMLGIDLEKLCPPGYVKELPADYNPIGQRRIDMVLDHCDRIGIKNRIPLSRLFGKIRDSEDTETVFDYDQIEVGREGTSLVKCRMILCFEFEYSNLEPQELRPTNSRSKRPVETRDCNVCGLPLLLNCTKHTRTHWACLYKNMAEKSLADLKAGICTHKRYAVKQTFPCSACRARAKQLGVSIYVDPAALSSTRRAAALAGIAKRRLKSQEDGRPCPSTSSIPSIPSTSSISSISNES